MSTSSQKLLLESSSFNLQAYLRLGFWILNLSTVAKKRLRRWTIAVAAMLGVGALPVFSAENIPADQLEFFESRIRPILVDNCYKCHSKSENRARGGLYVDTKQALLSGGDSGAAIVPGNPAASLMIKALKYTDPDMEMPPTGKLPDFVIRDFETWIRNGAPIPVEEGKCVL